MSKRCLARIAALHAENHQLAERVVKLEEELALARLHRFAARSEKHVDRLFNEAEQVGGYLARAYDPPPGNLIMWRGLSRFIDIATGATL
ncbi:hypothetical protein ACVWW1_008489 [Bradyrhizobium sp. JR3.5]